MRLEIVKRLLTVMAVGVGWSCINTSIANDRPFDANASTADAIEPQAPRPIPAGPVNSGVDWRIYQREWTKADEDGYASFVTAIGNAQCSSLEICLASDANPYRHTDDEEFIGDCADMAYILRAYYAWKNGLPFSYQNAMRTADGVNEDLRYSKNGNIVAGRRYAIGKTPVNAPSFIKRIGGEVSTAMFRTHPENGSGSSYDDFYAVAIDREAIRPGALAYDIYGHVGIIYDIRDDGRVLVVASHPDYSVTRTVYGANFLRSKPALGAGLKAWRPIKLLGGSKRSDGSIAGGTIQAAKNSDLRYFSMEQYVGNAPLEGGEWHQGEFRHEGRTLDYYEYVRRKLASPDFAYNPVTELRNGMRAICGQLRDRKLAVDRARSAKVHLKPHPERLPRNIFGTYGSWENYSTPSRDARLKVSFIDLRRNMQELVEKIRAGDPSVDYDGTDLAGDLWDAFEEEKNVCRFTYWRSDTTRVRLNIAHIMDRLWDLSFDPYHCPERRWGAKGVEFETCTDDSEKTRWYNAQRFLRYQADRTYDIKMDFRVDELKPPSVATPDEGGLGIDAPPDADLRAYLLRLRGKTFVSTDTLPPEIIYIDDDNSAVFSAPGKDRRDPPFKTVH